MNDSFQINIRKWHKISYTTARNLILVKEAYLVSLCFSVILSIKEEVKYTTQYAVFDPEDKL